MMEGRQHNNLWAEKLSQVSLPDNGAAWLAMEALLDKEMPEGWIRDRRRWLLLVFLLLLLIGVCNCPGRGRFSAVTSRWSKAFQTVPVGDKIAQTGCLFARAGTFTRRGSNARHPSARHPSARR